MQTFTLVAVLKGHRGSVLGLTLSDDEQYLFSSSGDGTVRVRQKNTCHNPNSPFLYRFGIQKH
jgi:di- and tripeptidase